jgi:hypothetical protein
VSVILYHISAIKLIKDKSRSQNYSQIICQYHSCNHSSFNSYLLFLMHELSDVLTFFIWDMSLMIPSVIINRMKYWDPSWCASAIVATWFMTGLTLHNPLSWICLMQVLYASTTPKITVMYCQCLNCFYSWLRWSNQRWWDGWACSTHKVMRNAYTILVGKPEGKTPFKKN